MEQNVDKITIVNIQVSLAHYCEVCDTLLVEIESRLHTDYWFCAKCGLNYEISHLGQVLRSFRPSQQVVIRTGEK